MQVGMAEEVPYTHDFEVAFSQQYFFLHHIVRSEVQGSLGKKRLFLTVSKLQERELMILFLYSPRKMYWLLRQESKVRTL